MKLVKPQDISQLPGNFYVDIEPVTKELVHHLSKYAFIPSGAIMPESFAMAADIAEHTGARLATRLEYARMLSDADSAKSAATSVRADQPDTLMYKQGLKPGSEFRRVRSEKPMFLP
jgi:hypothetical protein